MSAHHPEVNSQAAEAVAAEFMLRANRCRIEAFVCLALALAVALGVVLYFVSAGTGTPLFSLALAGSLFGNANAQQESSAWVSLLSLLVLRLGAVVLAALVIHILYSFARHRIRTSDAMFVRACALRVAGDQAGNLPFIGATLSTDAIDFNRDSDAPINSMAGLAKSAVEAAVKKSAT